VVGSQLEVSALELAIVFIDILNAEIGYRNLSVHDLKVEPLGYLLTNGLLRFLPQFRHSGDSRIEFVFQLIVEAHTHDSPALGFNLVADLVIEAI
jgi:hypothetical protein